MLKKSKKKNGQKDIESVQDNDSMLPSYLKIVGEGDITLIYDQINFDGTRILLSQSSANALPRYDVLSLPFGMQIIVDIPGIAVDKPIGGEYTIKIVRKEGLLPHLEISGNRNLCYANGDLEGDTFKFSKVENYNEDTQPAKNFKHPRIKSTFTIKIPIPAAISDIESKISVMQANGILVVTLPNRVESVVPAPRVMTF